jgi:predicted glycogen debranching enzyme
MDLNGLLTREWLATNGQGGYAASTLPGLNTRKYHGLLVAAMAPPVRRMVLLSRAEETVWCGGHRFELGCNEYPGCVYPQGQRYLVEFQADPFPQWTYAGAGWRLVKSLRLLRGENTVVLTYRFSGSARPVDLELRPMLAMRPIHELTFQCNWNLAAEERGTRHHRVPATNRSPEVFFAHNGRFQSGPNWYLSQIYRREQERGYAGLEDLWCPGVVRYRLDRGRGAQFVCSADPIDFARAIRVADAQLPTVSPLPSPDPALDALRRAAEQFVVSVGDGTDRQTQCMTAYPWAAPSGREALIAFAGLFLVTGRIAEAKSLLMMFASKLQNGLMPSRFPENGGPPVYEGADVSLWFVNAVWDYLRYTNDETAISRQLLDVACRIVDAYQRGAGLGVRPDSDGLLATRSPGIPATWMDAKLADWVVTPRVGRPVELNALWYNVLRITGQLCARFNRPDRAKSLTDSADRHRKAFNERFWNESTGCCLDVVEDHGRDPSVRPNQLLALSLPFAVLDVGRHESVLNRVRAELLAPTGVRTLAPQDSRYVGRYEGNVQSRDRAHHNGSAFPWLLGSYVTALMKLRGRGAAARAEALELLRPCLEYLLGDGAGQLPELFDGDAPHRPGGAIASAASIGELLRCYTEDVLLLGPVAPLAENETLTAAPVSTPPRGAKKPAKRR